MTLPEQARETVVAWLEQRGLYRGRAGNAMRLGLCSRSKDVIEPVLKPQVTKIWFLILCLLSPCCWLRCSLLAAL